MKAGKVYMYTPLASLQANSAQTPEVGVSGESLEIIPYTKTVGQGGVLGGYGGFLTRPNLPSLSPKNS